MTKVCKKCGVEKAVDHFNRHKKGGPGFLSTCRACQQDQHRQYKQRIAQTTFTTELAQGARI